MQVLGVGISWLVLVEGYCGQKGCQFRYYSAIVVTCDDDDDNSFSNQQPQVRASYFFVRR